MNVVFDITKPRACDACGTTHHNPNESICKRCRARTVAVRAGHVVQRQLDAHWCSRCGADGFASGDLARGLLFEGGACPKIERSR